ncbi:dienelactone hydrolase family protein [Micromonospora auratinigra]|uniref:Dienelactone hydrolase n=1 Tax=Micromonospora auratinigra TaxID=261654 RepID=A0A1A8ZEP4_9ACTN|nr:dienelactone hydrolase family protein [Micromonospora auratinigra]SBT42275.1 Dienelactone hydrolase [Micromonospora auratinigra]
MAHVLLLHSVLGLRPAVRAAADRLRAAGHQVTAPDLYGVPATDTVEEGFARFAEVGPETVLARARAVAGTLPADTVLAGFSMGAGLAGALLAERPDAAAVLLLHGTGGAPESVRPGLPVQLHLAVPDAYEPDDEVTQWRQAMTAAGAELSVHRYPGPGHLFTDPDLPDHDAPATALTWDRTVGFLAGL